MVVKQRFGKPELNHNMRTIAYADTLQSKLERTLAAIRNDMKYKSIRHNVVLWLDNLNRIQISTDKIVFIPRNGGTRASFELCAYQLLGYLLVNQTAMDKLNSYYQDIMNSVQIFTEPIKPEIKVLPKYQSKVASLVASIIG